MLVRRANIDLIYDGVNISDHIEKDLEGFSYTDPSSGEADSISITLSDDTGKWITNWVPQKGEKVQSKIKTTNWRYEGDGQLLDCGSFVVDEVAHSGRPRIVTIDAISVPAGEDFRERPRSRTWKKADLKQIANSIAYNAGISLYFDSLHNPSLDYVEQSEISDMEFLYELCKKNGFAMKVYSSKIILFKETEYEQKDVVATFKESDLLPGWNAKDSLTDTGYAGVTVEYSNPDTGQKLNYTFKIDNAKTNKIFKVNEAVNSVAEAERLAKSTARELNKKETTLNISVPGNLLLIASCCVNIKGLGHFDGKYYIDKATHNIGTSYTVDLELHRCLEGY